MNIFQTKKHSLIIRKNQTHLGNTSIHQKTISTLLVVLTMVYSQHINNKILIVKNVNFKNLYVSPKEVLSKKTVKLHFTFQRTRNQLRN